ncbi:hypothetical protein [Pseudoalteromonas denitrificans]|uniref:Uncharacterized protein n=1 Tax=Pseudoalteromonas denitrificans DSM 6059 TaxID=1123010 RepID=A0A1I1JLP4_9GAMM|nr:hypothetical protein [Pseudoalteromonas denitrificans]SFC48872.1 hypothetical protein SAMN02745724_01785 [Pseudoalteromonas denitrificans DSM 6059]
MKFKLNKKKLKNLSKDYKKLPVEMTAKIAAGRGDFVQTSDPTETRCGVELYV